MSHDSLSAQDRWPNNSTGNEDEYVAKLSQSESRVSQQRSYHRELKRERSEVADSEDGEESEAKGKELSDVELVYASDDETELAGFQKQSHVYKKGDCVYVSKSTSGAVYQLCLIDGFFLPNGGTLRVTGRRFYRHSDMPEVVCGALYNERGAENEEYEELLRRRPSLRCRELFISDTPAIYPVSAIKGACKVVHYHQLSSVKSFVPEPDTFFYILHYNPDTCKLASTMGEIRVGGAYQAVLPPGPEECRSPGSPKSDETWLPQRISDHSLHSYLTAARSVAAFAGFCSSSNAEDAETTAYKDNTTIQAYSVLHKCGYQPQQALQSLVSELGPPPRWSCEEQKRFLRGLKQHGKNFFAMRETMFQSRSTDELVEYYYYWKKLALSQRNGCGSRRTSQRREHKRKRPVNGTAKNKTPLPDDEFGSSSASSGASESESESESKTCSFCSVSSSLHWHAITTDRTVTCTHCYVHYKKYGLEELHRSRRSVFRPVSPPSSTESPPQFNLKEERTSPAPHPPDSSSADVKLEPEDEEVAAASVELSAAAVSPSRPSSATSSYAPSTPSPPPAASSTTFRVTSQNHQLVRVLARSRTSCARTDIICRHAARVKLEPPAAPVSSSAAAGGKRASRVATPPTNRTADAQVSSHVSEEAHRMLGQYPPHLRERLEAEMRAASDKWRFSPGGHAQAAAAAEWAEHQRRLSYLGNNPFGGMGPAPQDIAAMEQMRSALAYGTHTHTHQHTHLHLHHEQQQAALQHLAHMQMLSAMQGFPSQGLPPGELERLSLQLQMMQQHGHGAQIPGLQGFPGAGIPGAGMFGLPGAAGLEALHREDPRRSQEHFLNHMSHQEALQRLARESADRGRR